MGKQKSSYKGLRPKAGQANNEQIAAAITVAETGAELASNTAWDEGADHAVQEAMGQSESEAGETSSPADEAGQAPAPAAAAVGEDRPATIEELEAVCEDAPADFLIELLKARVTMGVASATWIARRRLLAEAAAELESQHGGIVIEIQFPMARVNVHHPGGYQNKVKQHVELSLRGDEKNAVLWIKNGLENARAKLNSGRYVSNYTDSVRWIIEQATRQFLVAEHVSRKAAPPAEPAAAP